MGKIAFFALVLLLTSGVTRPQALFVPAQSTHTKELGAGKILVASRDLSDPNFAETVVLLVHYDEEGVLGLILNRRTEVPISRLFRELRAKGRTDPVYAGGPVRKTAVLALLRSDHKPEEAEP